MNLLDRLKKIVNISNDYGWHHIGIAGRYIIVHEHYNGDQRWSWHRARCEERVLRIPVGKYDLEFHSKGKSYLELVDGPEYLNDLNWILDEFDSSFNDLAISSLKYHLGYSICDKSSHRETFEGLIERLGEDHPNVAKNEEEEEILRNSPRSWHKDFDPNQRDPRVDEIYDDYNRRVLEYEQRINQARKDFVDIMPYLWS